MKCSCQSLTSQGSDYVDVYGNVRRISGVGKIKTKDQQPKESVKASTSTRGVAKGLMNLSLRLKRSKFTKQKSFDESKIRSVSSQSVSGGIATSTPRPSMTSRETVSSEPNQLVFGRTQSSADIGQWSSHSSPNHRSRRRTVYDRWKQSPLAGSHRAHSETRIRHTDGLTLSYGASGATPYRVYSTHTASSETTSGFQSEVGTDFLQVSHILYCFYVLVSCCSWVYVWLILSIRMTSYI